jgi:hypothetical protein
MSLVTNIPKTAIVLPSNVRVQSAGGTLILQKIKRRTKKFKMSKAQRQKISTAARKFKWPLLTSFAVGPAVLVSAKSAMARGPLIDKLDTFVKEMISYYTGVRIFDSGSGFIFEANRLAIGWGPIFAVGAVKLVAKGRIMAINRALSRAQIPANLG